MASGKFIAVIAADKIAEKSFTCLEVEGIQLVICRFRDEYFALENQCSHARSSFDDGRMRAYNLICPLHGGSFDIRDGCATAKPARKSVLTFPVRVVDGIIEVRI